MTIDLIERLNLLLEGLGQDAKNSGNVILFDYDMSYPRAFSTNPIFVIKAIEYLSKYLLFNQRQSRILIEFELSTFTTQNVVFNIILAPSRQISESFDKKYLNLARKEIANIESELVIKQNEILLSVRLACSKTPTKQAYEFIPLAQLKRYHALISYPDTKGFEILRAQLEFLGINVRPSSDFLSAYTHIINPIYIPNIVFIYKDDIISARDRAEIIHAMKIKNFSVVVICEDGAQSFEKDFITLQQPYTYDTIYAILNIAHQRALQQSD